MNNITLLGGFAPQTPTPSRPPASGASGIEDCRASGIEDCHRISVYLSLTFSSRLGLRMKISARYHHHSSCNVGAHIFCFHKNIKNQQNSFDFQGAFFGEVFAQQVVGPAPWARAGPGSMGLVPWSHVPWARLSRGPLLDFQFFSFCFNQNMRESD